MRKFEHFETTADIGLRAYGKDLIELFENAALGMSSLMVEPFVVTNEVEKEFIAEGDRDEDILVSLLSEFLFLFETDGFLLNNIIGKSISSNKFQFTLIGETYSKDKHTLSSNIKAVTYHNLKIKKKRKMLVVEIVFDV